MDARKITAAFVTGPTGAVGAELCAHLLRQNIAVHAVVRPDSPRRHLLPDGVHVVACDLSDIAGLPQRLGDVRGEAFFHLGWSGTTGDGRDDMDAQMDNIRHAIDAVRAAKALGCRVFVGAGSQAEYGRCEGRLSPDTPAFPETGYGIAKLCAGQLTRLECEKLGLDHVWVRILSVYGPKDRRDSVISLAIEKLLKGEVPALTACTQRWDFLYSEDAARALLMCAERGRSGAVYPLGSGTSRPLKQYLDALRDAIDPGLEMGYGRVPYGPRPVMHLEADIAALRGDTGFQPSTPFEVGIRETIEWVRSTL